MQGSRGSWGFALLRTGAAGHGMGLEVALGTERSGGGTETAWALISALIPVLLHRGGQQGRDKG